MGSGGGCNNNNAIVHIKDNRWNTISLFSSTDKYNDEDDDEKDWRQRAATKPILEFTNNNN